MKPPLSWSIDGAAKTCLVPTVDGTLGPEALSRADFLKLGVPRAEFERRAREAASAALLTLKPEFVRDSDGVILYAVLQSSDGLAASTILAPEFSRMFKDALGEDLVIAVPERDQVLIFSRQDPQYQRMSARIIDSYRDAIYPVSIEAFTFQRGELRAIGEYTR